MGADQSAVTIGNDDVDPAALEGDDLVQWYRRPPWQVDQERQAAATPMHRQFHKELQSELRKAGFPPVGGKSGSADAWRDLFKINSAYRDKAMEVLQRTTRNFDISRGTSISPYLDKELRIVKPTSPP